MDEAGFPKRKERGRSLGMREHGIANRRAAVDDVGRRLAGKGDDQGAEGKKSESKECGGSVPSA